MKLAIVKKSLAILQVKFKAEPIFDHREPNSWYVDFTQLKGLKLRTHRLGKNLCIYKN